jgi:hypothetical protein
MWSYVMEHDGKVPARQGAVGAARTQAAAPARLAAAVRALRTAAGTP